MSFNKWIFFVIAILVVLASYWYNAVLRRREEKRVEAVLAGLLRAESRVAVNPAAKVAVGFGGCLDVLSDALLVLEKLGSLPPETPENFNLLIKPEEFEKTFAYFFMHGASAGYRYSFFIFFLILNTIF